MGEGISNPACPAGKDAGLMPFISSANIACGYHAGDTSTMKQTVELCLQYRVAIGAHPGFADIKNFGRSEIQLSSQQVYDLVAEQVYSLQKICRSFHTTLHHVKPHGALYNMAAGNKVLAAVIAKAVKDIDADLILYGLSGSHLISESEAIQLQAAREVFADRTYQDDGSLTPRKQANALIEKEEDSIRQVLQMIQQGKVTSTSGNEINIVAETICLHGDGKHAVAFAKKIHTTLNQNKIEIKTI